MEQPNNNRESSVFGVSLRGIIAMIIVITACAMAVIGREITEPLYTVFVSAVAFYFGQKTK